MKPYYDENGATLYHGDCLAVMGTFAADRFASIITDPPYGLSFMGKAWDHGVPGVPFWAECLRVAKPGAMLLAFGGTRTFHRLTCAIEDAGWEIRDCMSWMYGSGFPKSLDISKAIDKAAGAERTIIGHAPHHSPNRQPNKAWREREGRSDAPPTREYLVTAPGTDAARQWCGWGTALKPAWEPIVVAMKPLDGTFAENAQRHGVAGLNIDGGRIGADSRPLRVSDRDSGNQVYGDGLHGSRAVGTTNLGRWPANVLLDEDAAAMLDAQSGTLESGQPVGVKAGGKLNCYGTFAGGIPVTGYGDAGGASRFFYTAKASRSDRGHGNDHPTVKPLALMKYLCTLTATPTGGEVLDPFGGSMTTIVAAREVGRPAVGIDLEERHCAIGVKRLSQGVLFGSEVA